MINRKIVPLSLVVLAFLALMALSTSCRSADEYPDLRQSVGPALQKQLEQLIRKKGLQKAVKQERLAIALVDISDVKKPARMSCP